MEWEIGNPQFQDSMKYSKISSSEIRCFQITYRLNNEFRLCHEKSLHQEDEASQRVPVLTYILFAECNA